MDPTDSSKKDENEFDTLDIAPPKPLKKRVSIQSDNIKVKKQNSYNLNTKIIVLPNLLMISMMKLTKYLKIKDNLFLIKDQMK